MKDNELAFYLALFACGETMVVDGIVPDDSSLLLPRGGGMFSVPSWEFMLRGVEAVALAFPSSCTCFCRSLPHLKRPCP